MPEQFTAPGLGGAVAIGTTRPPGPGGDVRRLWLPTAQTARALVSTRGAIQSQASLISNIKRPLKTLLATYHPFKIYQVPTVLRFAPNPATDWRKIRVRSGLLIFDDFDGITPDGTDDAALPDTEDIPADLADEITAPEDTAKFYLWIDYSDITAPFIGYDIAKPDLDGTIIPLGWADSHTNSATRTLNIRQLLRTDWFLGDSCPL